MNIKAKVISFIQTPLILNKDKITMIYVLSGDFIAKRFNRIDSFQAEDLFFINPNEIYSFSAQKRSFILIIELDEIHQLNNYIKNGDQLVLTSSILGSNQLKEMELVYRDCGFIQLLLGIGIGEIDNNTLEKIIYLLFENYNVFFQNTTKNKVNIDTIERMYRIISKIHKEPHYKFSLQKISDEENMQKSYFAQNWKLLNDCSFLETVTKIRLQEAEKLLFFSTLNNEEICKQCGFSSKKYFYRYFQELFHMTPLQWKNKFNHIKEDYYELKSEESEKLLKVHLEKLSFVNTNTHFMKCYEKICNVKASHFAMTINWFHPDNRYELNDTSYMTCYGLDLLIYEAYKKNIDLIFEVFIKDIPLKKDHRTIVQQLKKYRNYYQSSIIRHWKIHLCVYNENELNNAFEIKKELSKLFITNNVQIVFLQ